VYLKSGLIKEVVFGRNGLIREVVSLVRNKLLVFHYLGVSEVWPYKRDGLWREWLCKREGATI
jgi:hypothetical protein